MCIPGKSSVTELHPQPFLFGDRFSPGYPGWFLICHSPVLPLELQRLQSCATMSSGSLVVCVYVSICWCPGPLWDVRLYSYFLYEMLLHQARNKGPWSTVFPGAEAHEKEVGTHLSAHQQAGPAAPPTGCASLQPSQQGQAVQSLGYRVLWPWSPPGGQSYPRPPSPAASEAER